MEKLKVLIVEDNIPLAENLFEFLGEEGYALDFAADGNSGLRLICAHDYDVIVLDVMLPGMNGFELCRRVRQDLNLHMPIIMLTAKEAIDDKARGFNSGADDYLTKPFDLRELELRINALARRNTPRTSALIAEDIEYLPGKVQVRAADGRTLNLSGTAATLFEALIRAYPNYVPYDTLCEKVWGTEGDPHVLRTHIYSLRKNLKAAFGRAMIHTLHGRGYSLRPALEAD